ncbi:tetratricopeptide repeat protein, partial [bacterium]|nr:tetratricopeptide repeat protein [bacterium]
MLQNINQQPSRAQIKTLLILVLLFTFNSFGQDFATVKGWIKTEDLDLVYPAIERLLDSAQTAKDSFEIAKQYFEFAIKCQQFYDSEISAKMFQRVREICLALNNIEYVYYTLINQANAYWHIDRLSESFDLLQQAMNISEKYHFQQTDSVAYYFIFTQLGILSARLGDYVQALKYYNLGLSFYEDRPIYTHISASLYLQKGRASFQLNDYEKAEESFFLAWEKSQRINNPVLKQDRQVAILNNLAELYYRKGNLAKAIKFYLRIFPIMKLKDDETDIIYYDLGNYQLKAGQFNEALKSFQMSLTFGGKTWNALSGLAWLKSINNETMAADSLYQKALEAVENRSRYVSGTSVAAFFEEVGFVYKRAALFYIRSGRAGRALEVIERAKARYMSRLVTLADLRGEAGEYQDSLKTIEKKISRFYEANPDSAVVNVELYASEIEREKILEKIRLENPNYFQFRSVNNISTDSLQRVLGEMYQLVEYVLSDDSIAAIVVTGQSISGVIWEFQKDSLTNMIKKAVTDNNNISINDLNRLYRKFFQPVEPFLSKEKTLIIIPDGVLYQ